MPRRPPGRAIACASAVVMSASLFVVAATAVDPGDPVVVAAATGAAPAGAAVAEDHGIRVDRRTQISASAPVQVTVGGTIAVSGVAKLRAGRKARPRPVRLQERSSSGAWVTLGSKKTSRVGAFRFATAARTTPRTRTFRVAAPAVKGLPAARTRAMQTRVVEVAAPPGSVMPNGASDWSWLFDGGARWNPCQTIRWSYNPTGSYDGSLEDMTEAMAKIADRTGLHFTYVGTTPYVHGIGGTFPADTDLTIGWATAAQVAYLTGSVVGVGGGSATTVIGKDVRGRIWRGYVVLDTDATLLNGFAETGPPTWGQVMLHEAMHALGLGHAAGQAQVMYGAVSSTNHLFGAGDLTGLSKVGAPSGCL